MSSKLEELLSTLSYAKNVVDASEEKHDVNLEDVNNYLDGIKFDLSEVVEEYDGFHKKIKTLKETIEGLEEQVEELEKNSIEDFLPQEHQNIRMVTALQTIWDNINYIDVADLEALANKTPMLQSGY